MYASKMLMEVLPNIHLLGVFTIAFTVVYRKKALYPLYIFVFLTGLINGFGTWWIMYLYLWPMLAIVTLMCRKTTSAVTWSIIAGAFGLLFGFFGAIPYIFIGSAGANLAAGLSTASAGGRKRRKRRWLMALIPMQAFTRPSAVPLAHHPQSTCVPIRLPPRQEST